jgi:hypothetical protein
MMVINRKKLKKIVCRTTGYFQNFIANEKGLEILDESTHLSVGLMMCLKHLMACS